MNMTEKLGQFMERSGCSFIVATYPELELLFANNTAQKVYGLTEQKTFQAFLETLQESSLNMDKITNFHLLPNGDVLLDDVEAQTMDGKKVSSQFKIGSFNDDCTECFIEITQKNTHPTDEHCNCNNHCCNAENIVHFQAENTSLKKYLDILQELTDNILYRVDAKTRVLHHTLDTPISRKLGKEIHNYATIFQNENVVHPEDASKYLDYLERFYSNNDEYEECTLRFALVSEEYEWYTIHGKKIFDEEGNLVEVLGAMINVEEKQKIIAEFDQTKEYFNILQSISNESFYSIDIKTKTLTQKGTVAHELGLAEKVNDFPESVFYKIHPEDLETYKKFSFDCMEGHCGRTEVRVLTVHGDFQWYEIIADVIRNKDGDMEEVVGKMNNIQSKKTMESEYSNVNQYFTALQSVTGESFYTVDVKRKILRQKGGVAAELGLSPEIYNFPESYEYKIFPDDLDLYRDFIQKSMSGQPSDVEIRIKTLSGNYEWYQIFSEIIRDKQGNVTEFIGKMNNIHDNKQIQANYSILNQYFSAMQNLTPDKLFHIDIKTKTFHHDDRSALSYGFPLEVPNFMETMVEQNIVHPDFKQGFLQDTEAFMSGKKLDYKVLSLVAEGVYEWFHVQGRFIHDENGEPIEIFGKMENIQKKLDLENRANHDPLTKVLNKVVFAEKVEKILSQHTKGIHHALVIIDMDDFKEVNDTYGHPFGDFVLENFAHRIKNCIRDIDLLGRLGGDEFIVFLKGVFDKDMALNRVNTMIERLKLPFSNGEHSYKLSASIGIAIIPEDGITYDALYSHADKATYESKHRGKNMATLYSEDLH